MSDQKIKRADDLSGFAVLDNLRPGQSVSMAREFARIFRPQIDAALRQSPVQLQPERGNK